MQNTGTGERKLDIKHTSKYTVCECNHKQMNAIRSERRASISNKIKEFREKRNWTQIQLAKRLDVHRYAIIDWETQRAYPIARNRAALCELFSVEYEDLFYPAV